jgi:hypothetical protein
MLVRAFRTRRSGGYSAPTQRRILTLEMLRGMLPDKNIPIMCHIVRAYKRKGSDEVRGHDLAGSL